MDQKLAWIEPSIATRVSEISDKILNNEDCDSYRAFMNFLRNQGDVKPELIMELGDMFIAHTQKTVEESYRTGVEEMWNLLR